MSDAPAKTATLAETRNLYQRLAAVRVALGGEIGKGGTAPAEMGSFKFIAWDDVAEKIGGFMADEGVVMVPSERRTTLSEAGKTASGKTIWRAVVHLELRLVSVDNPADELRISWVGVGDDTSDKSVQKAITSATKYALLKLFLLAGADDADASDVTSAPAGKPGTAPGERPYQEGDFCPWCAEHGVTAKFKIAAGGRWRGRLQCTGKVDGEWQNHLAPVIDAEVINDSEPIP